MQDGRYERRQLLGDGGMGQVWRGVDTVLGRDVALKLPLARLAQDPQFAERFRREARAMASVRHENIIDIYDVCDSPGGPFIVMEYVPGGSVAELLQRRGRLSARETVPIVAQAARALAAAHRQGVVHRDVKPGNLLLRDDGSVVLTDFGIARTAAGDQITGTGQNVGTATYMAPELFNGGPATPATDIYALGVVAYECLSGRPPFHADSVIAVATMHVMREPPPLPDDVPAPVRAIVARAMSKDPTQRYASADELLAALEAPATTAGFGRGRRRGAARASQGAITGHPERASPPATTDRPARAPEATTTGRPARAPEATTTGRPAPRRSRRRWVAAVVALAVAGAAAGLLVRAYAGDNGGGTGTGKGGGASALPADLRDFAKGWPLDGCTKDGTAGDKQAERWRCPVDGSTSLYLIRYRPGGHRDAVREKNDRMRPLAGTVKLERGAVTGPGGAKGLYREYEVDIGSAGKPDWNDQIWFDNDPVESPPLALILRTPRTPDTAQALAHLRELWAKAGYSRPA